MCACACASLDIGAPFMSCSPTVLAGISPVGRVAQKESEPPFSSHTAVLLLEQQAGVEMGGGTQLCLFSILSHTINNNLSYVESAECSVGTFMGLGEVGAGGGGGASVYFLVVVGGVKRLARHWARR